MISIFGENSKLFMLRILNKHNFAIILRPQQHTVACRMAAQPMRLLAERVLQRKKQPLPNEGRGTGFIGWLSEKE